MLETETLSWQLIMWATCAVLLLFNARGRNASAGLQLAYFAGLALIHVPGASLYLDPAYGFYDFDVVRDGFELSTWGIAAFTAGVVFAPTRLSFAKPTVQRGGNVENNPQAWALILLVAGLGTQLVILPWLGQVPSVVAFLAGISSLSVVGVCLGVYDSLRRRLRLHLLFWLSTAAAFPLITLTSSAFIGFGTHSLIVVAAFAAAIIPTRRLWVVLLALVPTVFLALSLYVTYMRDRRDLRELFWYGELTQQEKVERVFKLFTEFEFFDPENDKHLTAIDLRLNQNQLVGAAMGYTGGGDKPFANGETVIDAFVAIIPRALWPGKPQFGGSGNMVSDYTGIFFVEGTSVGAGQVFEFYINFGRPGVVCGFLLLGFIIRRFDHKAAESLRSRDFRAFVLWFLPALAFLQAGGNLAEVSSSLAASWAAAVATVFLLERHSRRHPRPARQPHLGLTRR